MARRLAGSADRRRFRIWIARYEDWSPASWQDTPPAAVAVAPAESGSLAAGQVEAYLRGFNRRMLRSGLRLWAVAVPVRVRYEGDLAPGEPIGGGGRGSACGGGKKKKPVERLSGVDARRAHTAG